MSWFNKTKASPSKSNIRPLPKEGNKRNNAKFHSRLWWTGLLFCLTFLILPEWQLPSQLLSVGNICPKDIKAPFDFSVEDKTTTILRQNEAVQKVLPIYDFDSNSAKTMANIRLLFGSKTAFYNENIKDLSKLPNASSERSSFDPANQDTANPATVKLSQLTPKERWKLLSQQLNLDISFNSFLVWEEAVFDQAVLQAVNSLIRLTVRKGVIQSKDFLLAEKVKTITQRDLQTKREYRIDDINQFLDMNEAKEYIKNVAKTKLSMDKGLTQLVLEIALHTIQPNLFFNKSATEERKIQAKEDVEPVFFQIKKGEMIIREGERVKVDQLAKYNELINLKKHHALPLMIPGFVFLVLLLMYLMRIYLRKFCPSLDKKQFQLLIVILLANLIVTKLFSFIASMLSLATPDIGLQAYYSAIPFAMGALLVALLVNAQLGVVFSVVVTIFSGLQLGFEFDFFLISLLGGVGAVYGVSKQQSRTAILRAGLLVSCINLAVIIPFALIKGRIFSLDVLFDCLGGIAGGLIAAIIASAALPLLESLFKVTTDIRLLELSSLNQPLLKQLALEAPGTYHHSIVVGSLAEAAAEAVDAKPLLSRIGAFYHDIGKISKAEYFIENDPDADARHKKLSPNMSGLIIISHVKEGLELANQYKLPPSIADVIRQHHGTSLMRYFYFKAKKQETPLKIVNENDFCYLGPKPQTKEIGIIMLADAVEATSRTVTEPTPARLSGMVRKVINDIYRAGQLDECALTLRDLNLIAESFVRILTSVFHSRIDYPDIKQAGIKRDKIWKSKSRIGSGV